MKLRLLLILSFLLATPFFAVRVPIGASQTVTRVVAYPAILPLPLIRHPIERILGNEPLVFDDASTAYLTAAEIEQFKVGSDEQRCNQSERVRVTFRGYPILLGGFVLTSIQNVEKIPGRPFCGK